MKKTVALLLILLLFPYVTVMLAGRASETKQEISALEQMVLEILPGQMPVTYEIEALKAQAIIIRSNLRYLCKKEQLSEEQVDRETLKKWDMDFYTLQELRNLWGDTFYKNYEKVFRAVNETCGEVLVFQGEYVDIPFHAVSAGKTRDGNILGEKFAYINAVDCTKDLESEQYLKVMKWTKKQWKEFSVGIPEILTWDDSGYVMTVRMGDTEMSGEAFRNQYHLPSGCFEISEQEDEIRCTVKGLGHGFGLSMYQANHMAAQGKKDLEILHYFYEELECISAP